MSDEEFPATEVRRSTWSPPPRRASGGEASSSAGSPSYSGLNLSLDTSKKKSSDRRASVKSPLDDSDDEHDDKFGGEAKEDLADSPLVGSPVARKGKLQRKKSRHLKDLSKQAQVLVQQKMRTENVLTLEEASKILSVLPSAALGALTAPRYIGQDWFEIMGPDRKTSYFYNTETGRLSPDRPEGVQIDKTKMLVTELNRRRREDFYVKLKMAAAEGLLQTQLRKKYGKQILRDEKEKVKTRRATESAAHKGFRNHAENEMKKEKEALEHLVHEFDPRGQRLISLDMFKAGIKKISESKLYKTSAGRLRTSSDEELRAVFLGIAGEDLVLTTNEFIEFTTGPKPPPFPPMMDLFWHFVNRLKSEMKHEDDDEEVGGGMETSIIRQLTFEVRSQARNTIVKSFRELEPVRYWGFIDLDLIANIDDDDFSINAVDDAERQSRLKQLREDKNRLLRRVQPQTYVSTTIQDIFYVGNLYKRAQSGAWILRQFVLTGEGVLQSQKIERKNAGATPLTTEELIAQANAEFQAAKRESRNSKTPRRKNSKTSVKDKFRLDPGNDFDAQIAQTSEVDFTLVEQSTRLRAKDELGMIEWMNNLRSLYALLRQVHIEEYLKQVLADAKHKIAKRETVKANFFNEALATARSAELSSRNRTVKEIRDLQKYLAQLEALQQVIDEVKLSRSIDDLLDGITQARGIAHDSDVMLEAQELMEQLTIEKNAEIQLKLQEIEDEKKQLHARRQLLTALLDVFMSDRFSLVRRIEEAYSAFCTDKGINLEEEYLLFARQVKHALQAHVERMINKTVDAVAAIENLASSIPEAEYPDDADEDIREEAEKAIKRTINTICANLATEDKCHRSIIIEKVSGTRNEYHVQQEDGTVIQSVHSNNMEGIPEETPMSPSQHRDVMHKFRVGQNVDVWHGINDYLHVQEQISDAEVIGIDEDSKIVMALEMLGRCLLYLRKARKLGVPCDSAFKALRTDRMAEEEDYYLFDNTPFGHAINHMTLPDELVISDYDRFKDTCSLLADLVHYLESCADAAIHCGLEEDANCLRRLHQLKGNLETQKAGLEDRQNLYQSLDDAMEVMNQAFDDRRWIPAVVVKNDLRGRHTGEGSLIVDIQDTLLDGMAHVVTVPVKFLRTATLISCCDKGYFEVDSQVVLRKDKDAWSDGFRETITVTKVDVPQTYHEVDVEMNPSLRHELAFNMKYTAATSHGAQLSSIRAEQLELPPESLVENLRQGDTVYVSHAFLHLAVLRNRLEEAVRSGLDSNMQGFVDANMLKKRLEYASILTASQLELNIARFPYNADAAGLKNSVDFLNRAQSANEITLNEEDADLLGLADRYMEIVKARRHLRDAMLDASKLRNGVELKRALELAISYGVNPTSSLCKSVKQLMHTFVGENSKIKAEQQLQRVCESNYPILPDICPKLQTALFVGVKPLNPALISRATEFLMGGFTRRRVQFADLFKVIHQPAILSFLDQRDLNALLVNRQFYEYIMRHSYFSALQQRAAKLENSRPHRAKPSSKQNSPVVLDIDAPIPEVVTPYGFGSARPRFSKVQLSPQEVRKIELEKIKRAREKLLRKMWF